MSNLRKKLLAAKIESFEKTGSSFYLSGAPDDYQQIKSAADSSWWGARLWSRFGLLGLPKEERKIRLNMIAAGKETIKRLEDIELRLTSKDFPGAISEYQEFITPFLETFISNFKQLATLEGNRLIENQPKAIEKSPEPEIIYEEAPPQSNLEDKLQLLKDLRDKIDQKLVQKVTTIAQSNLFNKNKVKLFKVRSNNLLMNVSSAINKNNTESLDYLIKEYDLLNDELDSFLESIAEKTSYLIDEDFKKVAHNTIRRWIKRKLMGINPSMMNQLYLKIVDDLLTLTPLIDKVIDSLGDKEIYIKNINGEIQKILSIINSVNSRLRLLVDHSLSTQKKPHFKDKVRTRLKDISKQLDSFEEEGLF